MLRVVLLPLFRFVATTIRLKPVHAEFATRQERDKWNPFSGVPLELNLAAGQTWIRPKVAREYENRGKGSYMIFPVEQPFLSASTEYRTG